MEETGCLPLGKNSWEIPEMALRGHSVLLFLFLVCLKPLRGHLFLLFNFGLAFFFANVPTAAQPALFIVRFGLRGVGSRCCAWRCVLWVCGVGVLSGCAVWVCGVDVRCGCAVGARLRGCAAAWLRGVGCTGSLLAVL